MTRNPECACCRKSAAVKCLNQGFERYYCSEHFVVMIGDTELTQVVWLRKRGADLPPEK